jgi:hypothetical protein
VASKLKRLSGDRSPRVCIPACAFGYIASPPGELCPSHSPLLANSCSSFVIQLRRHFWEAITDLGLYYLQLVRLSSSGYLFILNTWHRTYTVFFLETLKYLSVPQIGFNIVAI